MSEAVTLVPTGPVDLAGLGAVGVLEAASAGVRARRLAEVAEMRLAAQWAVLNGHPLDGRDPMVTPGGEGTPSVREFALPELAMARETHTVTTRSLLADALDLMHRLPLTWSKIVAGVAEPWVARKVATKSRAVPLATVGMVDRAVASAITGHAPSTVLEIADAKVIAADPEGYAGRREYERRRRYVHLSRCDEYGYRHVIARVTAGDAVWVDAMVDQVADILVLTHGEDHNRDELRSLAFGWLARPADLLRLLLDHTDQPDTVDSDDPPEKRRPVWAPSDLDRIVGRLSEMSTRQLASLRGKATVYVHVTDRSLSEGVGVARVEGQGPLWVRDLADLIGHADIRLTPVRDLAQRRRSDAYEHDEDLKDQVWLLTGGDVFPFSPRTATRDRVDFDHPTPYDPTGPPGQTGPHNSGPLRRRHHRWKTFAGYRCRSAGGGRHLWQTPHGLTFLVDQHGTRRLDNDEADIMVHAPPGIDLYLTDARLEYAGA